MFTVSFDSVVSIFVQFVSTSVKDHMVDQTFIPCLYQWLYLVERYRTL
jgi:hypothetical protein